MSASMKGFRKFVSSCDRNKEINHDTWNTCALGQYYKTLGIIIPVYGIASSDIRRDLCRDADPLEICTIQILNRSGRFHMTDAFPDRIIATYGDLQDLLAGQVEFDVEKYYNGECDEWRVK